MRTRDPVIVITVDRQPALTIEQAAAAHGMALDTMRKTLDRNGAQPVPGARIGRHPLYLAATVDAALAARPGRGAPGVPRPHRPPATSSSGA